MGNAWATHGQKASIHSIRGWERDGPEAPETSRDVPRRAGSKEVQKPGSERPCAAGLEQVASLSLKTRCTKLVGW